MGVPVIIHLKRIFHCKPSFLGYPHLWKPPFNFELQLTFACLPSCFCVGGWRSSSVLRQLGPPKTQAFLAYSTPQCHDRNRSCQLWSRNIGFDDDDDDDDDDDGSAWWWWRWMMDDGWWRCRRWRWWWWWMIMTHVLFRIGWPTAMRESTWIYHPQPFFWWCLQQIQTSSWDLNSRHGHWTIFLPSRTLRFQRPSGDFSDLTREISEIPVVYVP